MDMFLSRQHLSRYLDKYKDICNSWKKSKICYKKSRPQKYPNEKICSQGFNDLKWLSRNFF